MSRRAGLVPGGAATRLLGTGLALGVVAGVSWAAARALSDRISRDDAENPRLLNWRWARAIATRAARQGEAVAWARGAEREIARREYVALVERAASLVDAYTGIHLPASLTQVHVFDRAEWVDANLTQFHLMFAPLDEAYTAALARTHSAGAVGVMGQVMLSGQMGILLGYLARRVLGQYDLSLLGREPVAEGRLYFVEPNIAQVESTLRLPPQEFRAWIALHEVTHAFEFEAHPWARAYMNELLTVYLRTISEDLFGNRSGGAISTFASRIKDNLFESGHLLEMMMSPEQRVVFRKLQALMSLMEGYSNHVMDVVGAQHLKDHKLLKQSFESRAKNRGAAEQVFIKLTGLDIKLEQYALGERFCQQVVERRGIAFLNQVWQGVEYLPTLEEISDPARWVERHSTVVV